MAWNRDTEVLVVGAGPVGMLTALALRERGVDVRVVDEQWRTAARSYALAVHPSSLELFDDLGMAADLIPAGHKVTSIGLYEGRERKAKVDLSSMSERFPYVLVLPQNVIEEVLESRLQQRGGQIDWNHRLAEVDTSAAKPDSQIERLEKESSGYAFARTDWVVASVRALRSTFVVGADGYRSVVRRELGARFDAIGPQEDFAVFEFTTSSAVPTEVSLVLDEKATSVCWPMPGARMRWSFQIEGPESYQLKRAKSRLFANVGDRPFPQLDDSSLQELAASRAPWADHAVDEVLWSIAVRFQRKLTSRFGGGAVWLAGDAAHVARPVGVHSMNVGFVEAMDLAERLASILKKGAAPDQLDVYARQRRDAWQRLLADDSVRARPDASAWVASRASRIHHGIPASGAHLDRALAQLGLEWV